jgi:porin
LRRSSAIRLLVALASSAYLGLAARCPASAQPAPAGVPSSAAPVESNQPLPGPTNAPLPTTPEPTGLWERSNLLGNLGGLRESLGDLGVSYGLQETSEVLGNPTGGRRQGVIYEGLTEASLGFDLGKLVGLTGGTINISALQVHGRGLSVNDVDNLNAVSSIEAARSTRLYELWYDLPLLGGKIDVKVGQIGIDQEFMVSQYSGALMNATAFGFPLLPTADLPSGGPVYPLSAMGVRGRWFASEALTVLAGVFNGNPAGPGLGDPQVRDASGTLFRVSDGALVIAEAQYAINGGDHPTGLPGTYKLGAWYETNSTFNEQFGGAGQPLASIGHAKALREDYSVYVLADQLVFRRPGTTDQGLGVFARVMEAPGDRNLISFFADAGATFKGLIPGRSSDTAAVGVGIGRVSSAGRHLNAAAGVPIRSSETVVELTYQVQAAPWWLLQPDVQYVLNPGGGILNPDDPRHRVGDAAVLGLRTSVTF